MSANLQVTWIDRGVEPSCESDPKYPTGVDVDGSKPGQATCETSLPYPAKRCGYFLIQCSLCGLAAMITTAGRPDDPRSIKVPCKIRPPKKGDA
jgi:hypothetical protein